MSLFNNDLTEVERTRSMKINSAVKKKKIRVAKRGQYRQLAILSRLENVESRHRVLISTTIALGDI